MASPSPESDPAYFGFSDLNGFKDFVVYVLSCAPDLFPPEDWLEPEQQMNLERAFLGLRQGLMLVAPEVTNSELLARCRELVEEAYREYAAGRSHGGQQKLEEVERLLKKVPSK